MKYFKFNIFFIFFFIYIIKATESKFEIFKHNNKINESTRKETKEKVENENFFKFIENCFFGKFYKTKTELLEKEIKERIFYEKTLEETTDIWFKSFQICVNKEKKKQNENKKIKQLDQEIFENIRDSMMSFIQPLHSYLLSKEYKEIIWFISTMITLFSGLLASTFTNMYQRPIPIITSFILLLFLYIYRFDLFDRRIRQTRTSRNLMRIIRELENLFAIRNNEIITLDAELECLKVQERENKNRIRCLRRMVDILRNNGHSTTDSSLSEEGQSLPVYDQRTNLWCDENDSNHNIQ